MLSLQTFKDTPLLFKYSDALTEEHHQRGLRNFERRYNEAFPVVTGEATTRVLADVIANRNTSRSLALHPTRRRT